MGEITAHGLRHLAATILLNHVGKDLREIQELLRHKNIRTTVRYTHVGYEQTRETAEALIQALMCYSPPSAKSTRRLTFPFSLSKTK